MKRRSEHAAGEAAARRVIRMELLLERGPSCQRCHEQPWSDMHEVLSRARGGSPVDKANIACLCRGCHAWVTTHPAEATEEGWLRSMTPEEIRLRLHPWHLGEPLGPDSDSDTGEGSRAA